MNARPGTKSTTTTGTKAEIVTLTPTQAGDLIVGLYNLGCQILNERSPKMSVEMVRGVFERRLAVSQPKAMAALQRFPMRRPRGAAPKTEVGR